MKEIALVLAIGNVAALNVMVLGVLFLGYRAGKAKPPPGLDGWPRPDEADTHVWPSDKAK